MPDVVNDWTIQKIWEYRANDVLAVIVESRKHDVKVAGTWYQFDRHVVNQKGVAWIDVFELHPYAGFRAFYPDQVEAVRIHREPKKDPKCKS